MRPISGSTSSASCVARRLTRRRWRLVTRVLRLDGGGEALDDRAVAAARLGEQDGVEVDGGADDVDVDEPATLRGGRDGGAHVVLVGVAQHHRLRARVEDAADELWLGRRRDRQHAGAGPAQHGLRDGGDGDVAVERRRVHDHEMRLGTVVLAVGILETTDRDQGRVITDCRSQRLQPEALGSDQQEVPAVRPLGHSSLWCRALGAQVNLGKRVFNVDILIFHGYLLRGTGSNVYNARLAASMSSLGARDSPLLPGPCRRHARLRRRVGDWDSGALSVRTLREPVRVTTYRPPIGRLLPVYVEDRYEGFDAKRFADCTDDEIEDYLARNVTAVREVAQLAQPGVALANHLVMGPVILARALADVPYTAKIHGSALEYTVKPDMERFGPWAREGLARARGILVGSRHTAESLWAAMDDDSLPPRTRLGPPGVDVRQFRPASAGGGQGRRARPRTRPRRAAGRGRRRGRRLRARQRRRRRRDRRAEPRRRPAHRVRRQAAGGEGRGPARRGVPARPGRRARGRSSSSSASASSATASCGSWRCWPPATWRGAREFAERGGEARPAEPPARVPRGAGVLRRPRRLPRRRRAAARALRAHRAPGASRAGRAAAGLRGAGRPVDVPRGVRHGRRRGGGLRHPAGQRLALRPRRGHPGARGGGARSRRSRGWTSRWGTEPCATSRRRSSPGCRRRRTCARRPAPGSSRSSGRSTRGRGSHATVVASARGELSELEPVT